MHHLAGQPNIVELKGAYKDKHSVHLVMELCAGGELFDRIIAKGHYTERAAVSLLRTIVQIVHACHSDGVIHRELKPENFLLLNKDEKASLKATDFGLSVFYSRRSSIDQGGWSHGEAPDMLLDNAVLDKLKQYRAMNKFKKVALRVIAGCLSEEEIIGLKQLFKGMDTDNSGTITLEELKQGLANQGTELSVYEAKQLTEADGRINYDEFVAMMKKGNPDAAANPKKRRGFSFCN
ncbi:unnamed protein product [Fraxinus pennsylvanica]|uniref:Calcium-dependent protein kinase n=1 Tax=Fraxinus pennsylvanica TaxID=56036 RepID=A0AAD2E8I9_9LAMI|nr:unnamed protein product [Fraxinus pennsylvanica]